MKKFKLFLTELESQYKIFCDMDGVLVDFDRGWEAITTGPPIKFVKKHGKIEFWRKLELQGIDFWTNLKWMPDGKELWRYIKKHNATILSRPAQHPNSEKGKRIWIKRYLQLPSIFVNILF